MDALTSNEIENLFKTGTVILFKCKAKGDFPLVFVSKNCLDILGFTSEEMLEKENAWSGRIHPDDRQFVDEKFKKVIDEEVHTINEYRFRRRDGTYIWLRDEIKLIEEGDGEQVILGSSFDITGRKHAELKLKESKEQYESIVKHVKDVIFQIDRRGKWIFLNRAWEALTENAVADTIGTSAVPFVHPDDRKIFQDTCEHLIKGEEEERTNIVRVLKGSDGYVWAEIHARRVFEEFSDKEPIISGTIANVTEELAKQRKIEQLNKKLEERVAQRSEELKKEIEKRKYAEEGLQRRLSYEQAISRCANLILSSDDSSEVEKALRILLETMGGDSIYVYRNYEGKDGKLYMNPVHKAYAEGKEPPDNRLMMQDELYERFPSFRNKLSQNEIINARVRDLPEKEREILQSRSVKSILALPIFIDQEWYGFIGFNDIHQDRIWHEDEVRLLKTASEIMAAHKKRTFIQQSLIEQKNYTQEILDSLPSILLVMDEDLNVVHWNKNAEQITGYTAPEVKAMSGFDFIIKREHKKIADSLNRLLDGNGSGTELYLGTKSGDQIPFYWQGKTIHIEGRVQYLCVGLDISQQLETEKELRDEKRLNEALIDTLPGIFYMLDAEGHYLKWNKNFEEEFGYSAEEIHEMHPYDFYTPDHYQKVEKRILEVFRHGESAVESEVKAKDGSQIPYYLTGKLFERDGNQYLVGTGYNISEQKQAEQQLRKSELMFRDLFLKAPAAIVMVNEKNKVLRINNSFEQLFGFTDEELKGEDLDQKIVPEGHASDASGTPATSFKGTHYYQQSKRKTKAGELKDVFVGHIPIYVDGEPYVSFGMFIDISEQKKYEKEISESLKEKQVLLQEIHHRVKNNLAVISGLLQLQIYEIDDPSLSRMLQESQSRVKTMALIHEKLYQSQNLSRISCQSYIIELLETIQNTFEPVDKEVITRTEIEDVHLNINQAVPFGLLMNEVITNAFEHAFEGRKEGIISVKLSEEDGVISVILRDDGIGLPDDVRLENSQTMGMTLIINLLMQLEADWDLKADNGTKLTLRFVKEDIKGSSSAII